MRAFVIALGVLVSTLAARGQGTINFSTKITGKVDARVTYGFGAPAGGDYVGQLYAGAPGGALSAVGSPVPFRSDAGIGYITAGGRVVVPGIPGGSLAVVQLRVWKSSAGATYEAAFAASFGLTGRRSEPIVITLGGGGSPPAPDANLVGLKPIMIYPEPVPPLDPSPWTIGTGPPTLFIQGAGDEVILSWAPATFGYELETATDPAEGAWSLAPVVNPVRITVRGRALFYRLRRLY